MRVRLANHFAFDSRMGENGNLVAHRARRQEKACFLAELFRRGPLQLFYRGVVAPAIVAEFGADHPLEHGRRRLGHRVASQINK